MFLLILAISLSIDAFAVGFSLGFKNIKIAVSGFLVIGFTSFLLALVAMCFGSLLSAFFSPHFANLLGGFLLFGMGLWIIFTGLLKADLSKYPNRPEEYTIKELALQSVGISIRLLKIPQRCDKDLSGHIDQKEALPLACALSFDMLAGGIGIGAMGLSSLWLPLFVGILQMLFLWGGSRLGCLAQDKWQIPEIATTLISSSILIILAFTRMLKS